jgi:transcriptional regulator with XRE-family HTH domain
MKEISLENLIGDEDYIGYGYDHIVLRNRRVELGLTQKEVADKAKIQLRQYQRVESGERNIRSASARMVLAICAVLKINPYDFFPEYSDFKID